MRAITTVLHIKLLSYGKDRERSGRPELDYCTGPDRQRTHDRGVILYLPYSLHPPLRKQERRGGSVFLAAEPAAAFFLAPHPSRAGWPFTPCLAFTGSRRRDRPRLDLPPLTYLPPARSRRRLTDHGESHVPHPTL